LGWEKGTGPTTEIIALTARGATDKGNDALAGISVLLPDNRWSIRDASACNAPVRTLTHISISNWLGSAQTGAEESGYAPSW